MSDQRKAWTEYIERREREAKRRPARRKKSLKPTAEEMERALDELVAESEARRRGRPDPASSS
jgi:hypothetical protein